MSIKNYEPGDVEIVKIMLKKSIPGEQVEVNIKPQVLSMDIYEDIDEPTMLLELTMVDSINLVQDYPIIGEEIISVSYFTPGRENSTKKGFLVYSIEGTGTHPSSKASIYTIKAVSPTHYYNASNSVGKSYNDTIDNIVTDILRNISQDSQVKDFKLSIEKTKGLVPITIPNLSPFEAIDMLKQRAISAEFPSGGTFVFFENQYGVQFKSIEKLLKDGKEDIGTRTFTRAPDTSSDKSRMQYAFRNILRFNHLSKFNSIDKIASGSIVNEVKSFDIHSKQVETTLFKLAEKARQFTTADNKAKLPNSTAFIEKESKNISQTFFMSKDFTKGNDFIDISMGIKEEFSNLLSQNAVRVLINGDNYLSAGELVQLNLPETSGTTEKKNNDRLNSGNYLITKLRHMLTMEEGYKPKHQISMDCVRMGYK